VQVDASKVTQRENPGDALIQKYKIVGAAPDTVRWGKLNGLKLIANSDFGPRRTPTFVIEIRNTGSNASVIESLEIGPTLLTSNPKFPFAPSDGGSQAAITRGNLINPPLFSSTNVGITYSATYDIDSASRPPEHFKLEPGQSIKTRITFEVFPGQYQFLFGYGGGVHEEKSLASNTISFDLSDTRVATLAKQSIGPDKRYRQLGISQFPYRSYRNLRRVAPGQFRGVNFSLG